MCNDCSPTAGCHSERDAATFSNISSEIDHKNLFWYISILKLQHTVYLSLSWGLNYFWQLKSIKTLNQRMSGMGLPSTTTAKRGVSPAQTSRSSMIVSNVGGAVERGAKAKFQVTSALDGYMDRLTDQSNTYLPSPRWRCSCRCRTCWRP